ncbi:uncharacterized protein LOC100899707 [Galendromus occidentalis]|uniref:Uncharacterized protein LOC100899707 n=1 Tax=Galendromus occidentalis TaxID=34638 RepID=A0AAJ7PAI8_9ACAR|nr:uncharacterized protein LOC100899707 [Galendromus occidentalis]
MRQLFSCGTALLCLLFVVVAFVSAGQAAYSQQGQNAYPYPKAFMLHRRAGGMPNLSVVGPLDVLRRKMMLDMMEQRMKSKINANNEFLSRLGKRADAIPAYTALQQEWLENLESNEA